MTKTERLALIKEIAEKQNAKKAFKARQKANGAKVRRWTDVEERAVRTKADREFDSMIEKMDENHNQWTDSSQYAEKYYGETYRETTKFDNDWN